MLIAGATLPAVLAQHKEAQALCNGYHLYVESEPVRDALFGEAAEWSVSSRGIPFPVPMGRRFSALADLERELRDWLDYEPGAAIWFSGEVLLVASDALRARLEQLIREGFGADKSGDGAASALEAIAALLCIDLSNLEDQPKGAPR